MQLDLVCKALRGGLYRFYVSPPPLTSPDGDKINESSRITYKEVHIVIANKLVVSN